MKSLSLKHAQRRRSDLLIALESMRVNPGWIKYMRSIFGMTLKELAKRAKLSLPSVAQAEKREESGRITLETLSKMADAMECEFVYAFVPREDIPELLKRKAMEKARKSILEADIHMSLEDQKVETDLEKRVEVLAQKLLDKGKVW